jgi:hypothetical protein
MRIPGKLIARLSTDPGGTVPSIAPATPPPAAAPAVNPTPAKPAAGDANVDASKTI